MNAESVKIADRVSAIEAIKRLNEEDLLFLNGLIVMRLNKKTISVATNDGHQWNVSPRLLHLVESVKDIKWPDPPRP